MELTHQQKTLRTIREQDELLLAQEQLINLLKHEIRQLNQQPSRTSEQIESKLISSTIEIHRLRVQLHNMRENNDSLIQTFQAYKQVLNDSETGQLKRCSSEKRIGQVGSHLSQSLRARIKLHQDREPSDSPQLDAPSPYCLLYQYEFTDSGNSRYWQTEVFDVLQANPQNLNKVRSKLKTLGAKRTFPEQYRHLFWRWLLDNSLEITPKLFYTILERTAEQPKLTIVSMDLKRLNVLLDAETAKDLLADIEQCLYAFIHLRPDIGYVQGMPYFMWMLIIRMNKFQAFRMFCTIVVKDPLIYGLMTFNQTCIKSVTEFFCANLKEKKPKLSKHLEEHAITADIYLVEWAYTFFSRAFELELASKIWDIWLCEGSSVFFRTALAILELVEQQLLEKDYEGTLHLIKTCSNRLGEEELMRCIRKQKLSREWTI